ncbi:MAG: hypothetical protein JWR59_905 [Brevundimonas sp.]|nr:hypothetical protein [Brevundimonas sp.]
MTPGMGDPRSCRRHLSLVSRGRYGVDPDRNP